MQRVKCMLVSWFCTWIISAIRQQYTWKFSTRINTWLTLSLIGQASFYEQVRQSKLLTINRFQDINFSSSGFMVSEFQRYNIDDLYNLTLHLRTLAVNMNKRLSCHQCRITAHTLRGFHGEHQVTRKNNTREFKLGAVAVLRCQIFIQLISKTARKHALNIQYALNKAKLTIPQNHDPPW